MWGEKTYEAHRQTPGVVAPLDEIVHIHRLRGPGQPGTVGELGGTYGCTVIVFIKRTFPEDKMCDHRTLCSTVS